MPSCDGAPPQWTEWRVRTQLEARDARIVDALAAAPIDVFFTARRCSHGLRWRLAVISGDFYCNCRFQFDWNSFAPRTSTRLSLRYTLFCQLVYWQTTPRTAMQTDIRVGRRHSNSHEHCKCPSLGVTSPDVSIDTDNSCFGMTCSHLWRSDSDSSGHCLSPRGSKTVLDIFFF